LTMDTSAQILADGSAQAASAPAYSFDSATNAGLYITDGAGNRPAISQSGTEVIRFGTTAYGGITVSASVDFRGMAISNVSDPSAGDGIGDRDYNDGRYIQRDGSNTITGIILPDADNTRDLGASGTGFATIYATTFDGTATSALYADIAERYESDQFY